MGRHPRTSSSIILAGLLCAPIAAAQPIDKGPAAAPPPPAQSPQSDRGAAPAAKPETPKRKLAWAGTSFAWDQSATAQTVGIGQSYLSSDPTYDWTFSLEPVVTLYDDDVNRVRLNAYLGLFHEFTNSDTTTKQGETSVSGGFTGGSDAVFFSDYGRVLYDKGKVKTGAGIRLPELMFPTSKASMDAGVILGVGARLRLSQAFPITPAGTGVLESGTLAFLGGYDHLFTRAIVPVNPDLQRVRLDPSGRSLPGDQLDGTPFAEHQVPLVGLASLSITERLTWSNIFGWILAWKYPLTTVDVCGVVATGCTPTQQVNDPQRFGVVTEFLTELSVSVFDELDVRADYTNISLQLGPDGKRRNVFYSPDARVSLGLVLHLDALYLRATGAESGPPEKRTRSIAQHSPSISVE